MLKVRKHGSQVKIWKPPYLCGECNVFVFLVFFEKSAAEEAAVAEKAAAKDYITIHSVRPPLIDDITI